MRLAGSAGLTKVRRGPGEPETFKGKCGGYVSAESDINTTVCPGCSDPFYIVSYYIKWVTTSWTHSNCLTNPTPPLAALSARSAFGTFHENRHKSIMYVMYVS